jgi:hypothetical protein
MITTNARAQRILGIFIFAANVACIAGALALLISTAVLAHRMAHAGPHRAYFSHKGVQVCQQASR